jgi:transposase
MPEYQQLAKFLTEEEFNELMVPYFPTKVAGRNSKIPIYRVYIYITKVLRTGMQWSELQDCIAKDSSGKAEIHYTSVFKRFSQWTAFGVFDKCHKAILAAAYENGQLDLSIINGDGTNSVAKKGAQHVVIQDINIKKVQNE